MTGDEIVNGGVQQAPLPTALARRQSETGKDVVYVDQPKLIGLKPWIFLLVLASLYAALYFITRMLGSPTNAPVIFFMYSVAVLLHDIREVRESRYVIKNDGLEWIVANLAGGTDRIVARWEDIAWIGPLPRDYGAVKALEKKYKLSRGRIRTVPAVSMVAVEGSEWRVIRRGRQLYHAVDFRPSPQYLEAMRKIAPSSLFEGKSTAATQVTARPRPAPRRPPAS